MPWGDVAAKGANIQTGNLGDIAVAGKLELMRGVDLRPRYFCYVYNITDFPQYVPKGARQYNLRAATQSDPFVTVDGKTIHYAIGAMVPSVVMDSWIDDLGKRRIETQDGEEVAQDILCPTGDFTCDNNDLRKWGCGYFKRDVGDKNIAPSVEDIKRCMDAYDENMRAWVEDADKTFASGVLVNRDGDGLITPVHIRAANHFRLDRPWAKKVEHPTECPGCGEPMKKSAVRHTVQSGGCGFVAPENRQRAFDMGMVSREEAEMWGLLEPKPKAEHKPVATKKVADDIIE
jgi:hypothetical protein